MAEFCKQCNQELFGIPHSDFRGTPKDEFEDGWRYVELCEGCGGFVQVGPEGECVDPICEKHGAGKPIGAAEVS